MTLNRAVSSVLILALFVFGALFAIERYSDAQETQTCPAGTELAADGQSCLSPSVNDNVTTTTSCIQGVLSDDGQTCIVPRIDTPCLLYTSPSPRDS